LPVLIIAGPNLTLDRTATIDELRPGEVLRFSSATATAGGKGVNVARVAHALGRPARLVVLAPGHTGAAAAALLYDEGLDVLPVPAPGEVRVASIVLESSGRVTVLNEPGPELPHEVWGDYERAVGETMAEAAALVCSGSLPPGAPVDAYARLVRLGHHHGVPTLVDAAGPALETAFAAKPDVVTPNLAEAEGVLGRAAPDGVQPSRDEARRRALAASAELATLGPRIAVTTAGEAGAAVARAGEAAVWHDAPPVEAVGNPVGAGDSFLAGLALSVADGEPLEHAVAAALATGAASVETMLAGGVDPDRVEGLLTTLTTA
jgi:1-phosphofructokinase family hexose kinase